MTVFPTHAADHRFFSTMSWVAAIVIFTGFANTYLPRLGSSGEQVPAIVHVHAAIFSLWLIFFIVQTTLISRQQVKLHRQLGIGGVLLAFLMLAAGIATAATVAGLGHQGIPGVMFAAPEGFLLLNTISILVFFVLVMLGWRYRNKPPYHKRFMLMATVGGLMPPGISRLPFIAGSQQAIALTVVAFLVTPLVYDLATRRKLHPAVLLGIFLSLLIVPPVVEALAATPLWHDMAAWLMMT